MLFFFIIGKEQIIAVIQIENGMYNNINIDSNRCSAYNKANIDMQNRIAKILSFFIYA